MAAQSVLEGLVAEELDLWFAWEGWLNMGL